MLGIELNELKRYNNADVSLSMQNYVIRSVRRPRCIYTKLPSVLLSLGLYSYHSVAASRVQNNPLIIRKALQYSVFR